MSATSIHISDSFTTIYRPLATAFVRVCRKVPTRGVKDTRTIALRGAGSGEEKSRMQDA